MSTTTTLFEIKGSLPLHCNVRRQGPSDSTEELGSAKQFNFRNRFNGDINNVVIQFKFFPMQRSRPDQQQHILSLFVGQNIVLQISLEHIAELKLQCRDTVIRTANSINIMEENAFILYLSKEKQQITLNEQTLDLPPNQYNLFESLSNSLAESVKNHCFCGLEFSSRALDKSFSGVINDISVVLNATDQPLLQQPLILNALFNNTSSNEFPSFNYLDSLQPFDSLSELYYFDPLKHPFHTFCQPLKKFSRKPDRSQVIVCHDMMGGYIQDNFLCSYNSHQHGYRFYEWSIIDIFIYFSHRRISIPPASYVNAAHSNGVKCLGTLITEWEEGELENIRLLNGIFLKGSSDKGSKQEETDVNRFIYADKLIEVAKHYRFDGYLINIEAKIINAKLLVEWVSYLRDKMHQEIPGSLVIFYDSVISTGELKWQSQLNNSNKMFFEASDLFFTDYKWVPEKLQQSVSNAGSRRLEVFNGIDIFGRGTYQGGKFNSYLALKEILKNQSSVAFFAPGWTYEEEGGTGNQKKFHQREQEFWHGIHNHQLFDPTKDSWNYPPLAPNQPEAWQLIKEDNENVAVSSFFLSMRSFSVQVPANMSLKGKTVYFSFQVKGTPPNSKDFFAASIEGYSSEGILLFTVNTAQNNAQIGAISFRDIDRLPQLLRTTSADWEQIDLELAVPLDSLTISHLVFYQVGKDAEYWAGFYGARFKGEEMGVRSYDTNKDISKMLHKKRLTELPFHTFFNDGVGKVYFLEGERQEFNMKGKQKYYNNLHEFDFKFPYFSKKIHKSPLSSKHSIDYQILIDHKIGWNGVSSLQLTGSVSGSQSILVKLLKVSIKSRENQELLADIIIHSKTEKSMLIDLIFKDSNGQFLYSQKLAAKDRNNGWFSYFYSLKQEKQNFSEIKAVYLQLRGQGENTNKITVNLGGISLYDEIIKEESIAIMKNEIDIVKSCKVRENMLNQIVLSSPNYFVDLLVNLNINKASMEKAKLIRIFVNGKWLASVLGEQILLEKVELPRETKQLELKAQVILQNGFHTPVKLLKPFIVNLSEDLICLF